jgi:hypothetical protein
VVELGLLGAIDTGLLAGIEGSKDIGGEETDRFDVRAGLRRLQMEDVLVQKFRQGIVVALAEEISFADGGVGQRRVKGVGGRSQQKKRS